MPIFEKDALSSISIAELDLPTESAVLGVEKESADDSETDFQDLYRKYDEQYKSSSDLILNNEELGDDPGQRRSFATSDDVKIEFDSVGKSIIDTIQTILDPEVRKEFEKEIFNQIPTDGKTKVSADVGIEYETNYRNKFSQVNTKLSTNGPDSKINDEQKLTVHEKEMLQVHLVEQLVHINDSVREHTTIIPENNFDHHENIKNTEVLDVLEHIVYRPATEIPGDIIEHNLPTASTLQVIESFDPIEILPKDRHRFRNMDEIKSTLTNDKFEGFHDIPLKDLVEPIEETTEIDKFFVGQKSEGNENSAEGFLIDTLETIAILGKNIEFENNNEPQTVEITTILSAQYDTTEENKTPLNVLSEGTEVKAEVSVNSLPNAVNQSNGNINQTLFNKDFIKHSSSGKSSSDESDSNSDDSKENRNNNSSEENSAREIFDVAINGNPSNMMDELFRNTFAHDIKKKDQPDIIYTPNVAHVTKIPEENFIADHLDDKIKPQIVVGASEALPLITTTRSLNKIETTTTGFYETVEELFTTISEGIQLTNDIKGTLNSFRDNSEENKTVLDTNGEIISAKNIKQSVVNVSIDNMLLENQTKQVDASLNSLFPIMCLSGLTMACLIFVWRRRTFRRRLL